MPDFNRPADPDFDAVMRTDRFVDALASGARMSPVDPLSAMLGAWRDDVRSRPDSQVVTLAQASAAMGKKQDPPRRHRFGLTVVGAVAAAMLCLGGFGAVVYGAGPGDALYGLRSMLFGESTPTRNEAVALASQQLAQVRQLVQQGKWDEAQQQLVTLTNTVQTVGDVADQHQLVEQYNTLAVQVIQRNPEATLPPPGEPLPPMPSSPLTLLPVPVVPDVTSTSVGTPTVSTPLPTATSPLPTPTGPLPTVTGPLPTPTAPLPTPTGPLPTVDGPLPTPTAPLPTATAPQPTATGPLPTATTQVPRTAPAPTANTPLPTATVATTAATVPLPTATIPQPTANAPQPTANAPQPTANAPQPTAARTPLPTATEAPATQRTQVPTVAPTTPES